MRRVSCVLFAIVLLLGVSGSTHAVAAAQAGDLADHPLVGSWLLDTDTEDPANPAALVIFSPYGTYVEAEADGTVAIGVWESTGENTANLTFRFVDEDGSIIIIRASLEVAADGNSLTAEYSFEFIGPDGESTGEYGPGSATGTRAEVEAMGEPVGSLEDLFSQFGEEDGEESPEATPEG
jgi:hypothetical protein